MSDKIIEQIDSTGRLIRASVNETGARIEIAKPGSLSQTIDLQNADEVKALENVTNKLLIKILLRDIKFPEE